MANHPVFGSITNISSNYVEKDDAKRRNRTPRLRVFQGTNLATQGNLLDDVAGRVDCAENVVSVNPNLKCPLCEANYWLTQCHLFKGKSYEERYKFVRERGLCENCLQSGHNSFVGVSEGLCGSTGAGAPGIGFAVVPVKVKAKRKEAVVETYAFLDPGSDTSFCTDQLIERLGATGMERTLSLTTMSDRDAKCQSLVVCLEISDLCGNHTIELPNVFSRPSHPVSVDDIPRQTDVDR